MWTPWSLIGKESASNAGESESSSVMSGFLRPQTLYSPWNSLGQNTGVGSLSLLQGTFPTQKLNRGLLRCRRILYPLSCQGSSICLIHSIHSVHMSIAVSRPSHHSLAPSVSMHLSSTSVRLHLFCSQIICSIFIDSTYTH